MNLSPKVSLLDYYDLKNNLCFKQNYGEKNKTLLEQYNKQEDEVENFLQS